MSIWCYYIFWRRSGSAATAGVLEAQMVRFYRYNGYTIFLRYFRKKFLFISWKNVVVLLYTHIKKGVSSDLPQQQDGMLTAGKMWVQKKGNPRIPLNLYILSSIWLINQISAKYFKVNTYFC